MTPAAAQPPSCRFCGAPLTVVFADLGETPLANSNLRPEDVAKERKYLLIVRVCGNCLLVQADDAVPPGEIFSDYDYFSSYSSSWVAHAARYCADMRQRYRLGRNSLVVEIASNDGYLLQHFVAAGIPVLGIEPAANVAQAAIAKGVRTETAFFNKETAARLAESGIHADLIAANNVLAHVPDTRDFVSGFPILLKPEGVVTFEFPHVLRLIAGAQFDTIYHEHFFYLSLLVAEGMLGAAGLRVFDVEELATHGGSLRVFACHANAGHEANARLETVRQAEKAAGLSTLEGYRGFNARIDAAKSSFLAFMANAKAAGKTVAAYGAAAKGNTFLNVCGVRYPDIRAVFDRNTAKQGRLTPGSHIPIVSPDKLRELKPDYVVILPWNLAREIETKLSEIRQWRGRFVIDVPETRIL